MERASRDFAYNFIKYLQHQALEEADAVDLAIEERIPAEDIFSKVEFSSDINGPFVELKIRVRYKR